MLLSLALILLCGLLLGKLFEKLRLPSLLGMLITGIVLGPSVLNLISQDLLAISAELRQIALIIILTRAGLALDLKDLAKVGRPAVLMCFLPACCEIVATTLIAPLFLPLTTLESALLGTVIAAVSPAVIVPKMLKLMEDKQGTNKGIPQLIMAGASVDDVFVIVLFTAFTALAGGESLSVLSFVAIPTSIVFGIVGGIVVGVVLSKLFAIIHLRDSAKVIVLLSVSFLLVTLEHCLKGAIGFSGLLVVMTTGIALQRKNNDLAVRLSAKFNKLWVFAEIMLFVLVGATVDLQYALKAGIFALLLVLIVLVIRVIGVYICLIKTALNGKERLFCMIAYTPKATVQAAIGSIPLAMGLACGDMVLTVAVVSILVTAPLGALLIDLTKNKLLTKADV